MLLAHVLHWPRVGAQPMRDIHAACTKIIRTSRRDHMCTSPSSCVQFTEIVCTIHRDHLYKLPRSYVLAGKLSVDPGRSAQRWLQRSCHACLTHPSRCRYTRPKWLLLVCGMQTVGQLCHINHCLISPRCARRCNTCNSSPVSRCRFRLHFGLSLFTLWTYVTLTT